MKIEKLKRQIAKDLKKSPGKAGALGLLMLVGLWYWIPLAKQMLIKSSAEPTAAAEAPAAPGAQNAAVVAGLPASGETASLDWTALAEQLQQRAALRAQRIDTTRLPVECGGIRWVAIPRRDPFQAPPLVRRPSQRAAEREAAARPVVQTSTDLARLGIRLDSTVTSGKRRTALLNGRAVREGAAFQIRGVELVLKLVEPRRVVLRSGDRELELQLPERGQAHGLRLPPNG